MSDMENHPGVTWRDYVDTRLDALDGALRLAREINDARLTDSNHVRDQLRAQASEFVTTQVYDAKHETLQRQVDELRQARATAEGVLAGKASTVAMFVTMIGVAITLVTSIIGIALHFIGK